MAVEVVRGASRNRAAARALADTLSDVVDEGTIYLGYPVLATADEKVEVDALLVSRRHGLVAFLISDGVPASEADQDEAIVEQDRLFAVLESYLGRHEGLRDRRRLAVPQIQHRSSQPRHRSGSSTPRAMTVFMASLLTLQSG